MRALLILAAGALGAWAGYQPSAKPKKGQADERPASASLRKEDIGTPRTFVEVPRLKSEQKRHVADPRKAGYDPALLNALLVPMDEIFSAEPVDESWAAPTEGRIRDATKAGFATLELPATVKRVECRTATCRVEVDLSSSDGSLVRSTMQDVIPGSVFAFADSSSPDTVAMLIAYDKNVHSLDMQSRLLDEITEKRLQRLKARKTLTPVLEKDPELARRLISLPEEERDAEVQKLMKEHGK